MYLVFRYNPKLVLQDLVTTFVVARDEEEARAMYNAARPPYKYNPQTGVNDISDGLEVGVISVAALQPSGTSSAAPAAAA